MFHREGAVPLGVAACAALLPLLLAACGASEADKTPAQILQDASAATKAVSTYHLAGSGLSGGSNAAFDLHIGGPGSVSGSLTMSGVSFNLIVVNGNVYIKGRNFLQQVAGAQAAQLFGDNWVKFPSSTAVALSQGVDTLSDTKKLGGCLVTGLGGVGFTKSSATVNGQSVVQLKSSALTLDFASSGPTHLVQVRSSGSTPSFDSCLNGALGNSSGSSSTSGNGGTINFDSWGTAGSVTPPPHPVDASAFTGG